MRTMRRLLLGLALTVMVVGGAQAARTHRAVEAGDLPTSTWEIHSAELATGPIYAFVRLPVGDLTTEVAAQYALDLQPHFESIKPPTPGDEPTPFRTVTADGPGDLAAIPEPQVRAISFAYALDGVYLRQMTAAIRRSDGSLKLIVGCPERAESEDRALADSLMALPLPNAFLGAITGFQRWYVEAELIDLPGVAVYEWDRNELTAAWQSYAAGWLAGHLTEVEGLRPMVADAVIASGLRRAPDLMVTPAGYASAEGTRAADCITCAPPLACSCQTYDAATADCSGAAQSCTVIEMATRRTPARLP